jgi:hypothetical protein
MPPGEGSETNGGRQLQDEETATTQEASGSSGESLGMMLSGFGSLEVDIENYSDDISAILDSSSNPSGLEVDDEDHDEENVISIYAMSMYPRVQSAFQRERSPGNGFDSATMYDTTSSSRSSLDIFFIFPGFYPFRITLLTPPKRLFTNTIRERRRFCRRTWTSILRRLLLARRP